MKRVLVGHRGVGKTELLKRHAEYFPHTPHFDLDIEIERSLKLPLSGYFSEYGEAAFRKIEKETFAEILARHADFVVALGAGFDVMVIPEDVEVWAISRVTDADGRIFLNRPRLEPEQTALEEYQSRYVKRHSKYLKRADRLYHMPEGLSRSDEIEKDILSVNFKIANAIYTVCENDLPNIDHLIRNFKMLELRDDLLRSETREELMLKYPGRWLQSYRLAKPSSKEASAFVDCDVDLGFYPEANVISSHADVIQIAIEKLSHLKTAAHLKLAPLVESFEDLQAGYRWQQQDAGNRSFLPRSRNGRWVWYRQLAGYFQKINFVRGFTELADQPGLYDWLVLPQQRPRFWGAVLGCPVHFSRSPQEQLNFFSERYSFFTRIEMTEFEFEKHFDFLASLGLRYAAVTAPLKNAAYAKSTIKTGVVQQLKSANTLFVQGENVISENTDLSGFLEVAKKTKPAESVMVWGGGGTLEMLKRVLPSAHFYSSQSGVLRTGVSEPGISYDWLIWAAPRAPGTKFPVESVQIGQVLDLNYTENSMGLELAALRKIPYTSGLEMFKLQALKQQQFWSENERE